MGKYHVASIFTQMREDRHAFRKINADGQSLTVWRLEIGVGRAACLYWLDLSARGSLPGLANLHLHGDLCFSDPPDVEFGQPGKR